MKKVVRRIICALLVSAMLLVIVSGMVLAAQTKGIVNNYYFYDSHGSYAIVGIRQESINKSKAAVNVLMTADSCVANPIIIEIWITHYNASGGNQKTYHGYKAGGCEDPTISRTGSTTNVANGYAIVQIWAAEAGANGYCWQYKVYFKPESQGGVTVSFYCGWPTGYPPDPPW